MSWIDRLSELYELLAGLGVAVVVIAAISWLLSLAGSAGGQAEISQDQNASGQSERNIRPVQNPDAKTTVPQVGGKQGPPIVAAIYTAPSAGSPMERTADVSAVAGRGLEGDRYFLEKGHWSGTDDCEVTLIAQEDIDVIEHSFGVQVQNGEHRRNLVTCNLPIENLTGKRFRIGSANFGYECPRPPCAYIQLISEPGMTKALGRRSGICVRCIKSGIVREGDRIIISQITLLDALKYRARIVLSRWQRGKHDHG